MHFIQKTIISGLLIIPFAGWSQETGRKPPSGDSFAAPLGIPLFLSGNFGEIRTDHFHAGLDFKTRQTVGKEVLAADSGFVMRVSVQSGGYGHAVYLRHPGGAITVYGHLLCFEPALAAWVKDQQYRKKSFEVNLFPPSGRFVYSKGAMIGLSGNTGSSGGPHLHFEIRDKTGEIALNGLRFPFAVADTIRPVITRLGLYALDRNSMVNDTEESLVLRVNDSTGLGAVVPRVSGRIGFGVETFDFLNGSANICSPFSLALYVDNHLHFKCVLDSIPFALTGAMNSHIDYAAKITGGWSIQKLYLDPGNKLALYPVAIHRGEVVFRDTLLHDIHIVSEDVYGNRRELEFLVQSALPQLTERPEAPSDSLVKFRYNQTNTLEKRGILLVLPAGALYNDNRIRFSAKAVDSLRFSPLYRIGSETIPLQMAGQLSISADRVPRILRNKVYVATLTFKGKQVSCGGKYRDGMITTRMKSFGRYFLLADTVPPQIEPVGFAPGDTCTAGEGISFRITDRGSGISRYTGYIDGKWALFEFDAKNDLLCWLPDDKRLSRNRMHSLSLTVTDERGNTTRYKGQFHY